mmetsp:Transcript_22693/g.26706  ORF Transcript_22693/g.26706 Transcript_22693/m.26706 type:complete len:93 (+) Transcript_22693:461-739(+)
MLLNNYDNGNPWSPIENDERVQKRDREWGTGCQDGHRAAFCIPFIVPASLAYNIFQRQTPDMEQKGIPLGCDFEKRKVHGNRDVWIKPVKVP